MEQLTDNYQLPERGDPSRWSRLRHWLGAVGSTIQGNGTMNSFKGETKEQKSAVDDPLDQLDQIVADSLAEYEEETKWEPGRTEGLILPDLPVGAQSYPDPGMWGPSIDTSLTVDEEYGEIARLIDRLDRADGFDGSPRIRPRP